MTLHWWMHWFWITALLALLGSGRNHAAPQSEELQHITTDTEIEPRTPDRQGRAMYFPKPTPTAKAPAETNMTRNQTDATTTKPTVKITSNMTAEISHPAVLWTPVNVTDMNETSVEETTVTINTSTTTPSSLPVEVNNATTRRNVTLPYVKDVTSIDGISESKIVTEKPLSLETSFLQTRIPPNIESYRRVVEPESGMDTGAIAGISFAALVLGALAGSTAFVMYRRRYLNKPQTLNDKCSNPDSSGYLDDSTVRDNSEEMYSLDNDSFLNSLEAMTIQNYWTDTVKHTKL